MRHDVTPGTMISVPLPSGQLAGTMLAKAMELGYGHRDFAALSGALGG